MTGLLLFAVLIQQCTPKTTETTSTVDSVAVDSVVASSPAPSLLAYNPIGGFTLDNKLVLADTVNFFLFANQEELNQKFTSERSVSPQSMDFVINYIVAVACKPTTDLTTIVMDKVQLGAESIEVYVNIQRGEQQKVLAKPAQVFAIEKRDGFLALQFFVNGKKDKALLLPMN